jgi:hypothetical protein
VGKACANKEMFMNKKRLLQRWIVVLLGGAASAWGQLSVDVSSLRFDVESEHQEGYRWRFHPAMNDTTLVGFLAERRGNGEPPEGYSTVVWFERQQNDLFSTSNVPNSTVVEAAATVESALGQTHIFAHTLFAAELYSGGGSTTSLFAGTEPSPEPTECGLVIEQAQLTSLIVQVEGIVGSDGATVPGPGSAFMVSCCWPRKIITEFQTPAGPWVRDEPITGPDCGYERPMWDHLTVCTIDFWCNMTCWTAPRVPGAPQKVLCRDVVQPGAYCPNPQNNRPPC